MELKISKIQNEYLPGVRVFIDPQIQKDFPDLNLSELNITTINRAEISIHKMDYRFLVLFNNGDKITLPYFINNLLVFVKLFSNSSASDTFAQFGNFLKNSRNIQKKLISRVPMGKEQFTDLWDEVFKKVNQITIECQTLISMTKKILEIPFLQKFESSMIILHLKGYSKAEIFGVTWKDMRVDGFMEVKDFNTLFGAIKKSKVKSFSTESFKFENLPFLGTFIAKEFSSKKYSSVVIVSRNDLLPYRKREIELFETCIDLLRPQFESIVEQEFSDKKLFEIRTCFKNFPLPLRIRHRKDKDFFLNELYHDEVEDEELFYQKDITTQFYLNLYDSDELRNYAFDLFHFQRVSLLGELLNTLRHELSNPLFGLKLSTEILTDFSKISGNEEIMDQIQRNINRCQVIIENFSNLYQVRNDSKKQSFKKLIEESILLSKSETREIKRIIEYLDKTETLTLTLDGVLVVQILFNLIVNAAQAIRDAVPDPKIQITTGLLVEEVYIDVIDNGPEMPASTRENLFRPFFTTKGGGTGLGLTLSRNLAFKMGGHLEYLMNNNSDGARFRLRLPLK